MPEAVTPAFTDTQIHKQNTARWAVRCRKFAAFFAANLGSRGSGPAGLRFVVFWTAISLALASSGRSQTVPSAPADHKISAAEEAELFRSVDDLLKFASTETALPEREKVKRRLVSRDEVVAYLEKHMDEDEDAQRFLRSEVVLKKFGLIPRDFDLRPFLIGLLREQVAGYYDPATKTVNLLDWIEPEQQKAVLAHELTHALQDQSYDLQKWMKGTEKDLITVENPTSQDFELDEAGEARQAVVEGQATIPLFDYELIPAGMSVANSPQVAEAMGETMSAGTPDTVQFQKAPLFLKEALTFPYRYGLSFVAAVTAKRGKAGANALFQNPPTTTRQIMEPQTFLAGEKLPAMPVPDFKRLFKDYQVVDVGGFGEFDTAMLVGQYASPVIAQKVYPNWRGGYYYAVRPKDKATAPLGLLYVSRWSSAEKAAEFAEIYAQALTQRYQKIVEVPFDGAKSKTTATSNHTWMTEEGPVLIRTQGDLVLVAESLDHEELLPDVVLGTSAGGVRAGFGFRMPSPVYSKYGTLPDSGRTITVACEVPGCGSGFSLRSSPC